jgi:formate C-acetyltransferase
VVFNLRFSSSLLGDDAGVDRLINLVEASMELGIYQVQVNLASSETLRDAQRNPANYADLLVRIGGYLVPFTLLPKEAQEDVIARTEMEI